MTTPAELAIEAGARAHFDRTQAQRRDDGRKTPDGGPWRTETDRRAYRAHVAPIVTAALGAEDHPTETEENR